MEFLLLGLLGVAVTWGIVDAVRDDGDDTPPEPDRDPDAAEELLGVSNALLEAGGGNDTITAGTNGANMVGNATLRGGAGDDLFNLVVNDSEVFGGIGNDTIEGYARDSQLNGGAGDDSFDVDVYGGTRVLGGAGNDTIIAEGERSFLYGGEGDDVIDAREMWTSYISGGAGDDLLIVKANAGGEGGDTVYGGLGDDTLRAYVDAQPGDPISTLHGGFGNDVFQVVHTPPEYVPQNPEDSSNQPFKTLLEIQDFQPGRDQLQLDLGTGADSGSFDVVLVERATGTSVNILSMALAEGPDGNPTVPMQVTGEIWLAGATGVTMADISFVDLSAAA